MRSRTLLLCLLLSALTPAAGHAEPALRVVASFSILADLTREVGGERVAVHALVGPDQDAHNFQARPSEALRVREAQLVIVNGLGFDQWLSRLAQTTGTPLVQASAGLIPLQTEAGHHARRHGGADPHAWQSVPQAMRYVDNIAAALAAADPAGATIYAANAAAFRERLVRLDADIRQAIAKLPPQRRQVVSAHDAFTYFAQEYGIRFLAPAARAAQAEGSAASLAQLIRQIRSERVPAVFLENVADPRLVERIRAETGVRLGGTLYSDALSAADGPAPNYVAMMRHNLAELVAALAED